MTYHWGIGALDAVLVVLSAAWAFLNRVDMHLSILETLPNALFMYCVDVHWRHSPQCFFNGFCTIHIRETMTASVFGKFPPVIYRGSTINGMCTRRH